MISLFHVGVTIAVHSAQPTGSIFCALRDNMNSSGKSEGGGSWRQITEKWHLKIKTDEYIDVMKTPACRTSRELMGVQKSPNNFDLDLATLTYNLWPWPLWPWPWPSWPWPWTTFSETRLKTGFFTFVTLVTLTFDLWPWPSNSSRYDGS